ncbi:hypothetical protein MCUN1_001334 [Malassezia cuniculi]|uniref:Glutathione S-transferase kappa n=1 Tax=Malassezia cuniculi TaxID=948313 RepID=A0AAF0EXM0_9BASI|nr:hypothetical protein MCUN1_001334 [Malassezia cuniculi]
MSDKIVMYFDCVSPWSYVALAVVRRYKKVWNVELELIPMSLSYIMKFANNKPPITIPNKGMLMMSELGRVPRMYGVRISPPKSFPFDTMLLQQFLTLLKEKFPEDIEEVAQQFFNHIWRDGNRLATADEISAFAATIYPKEKLEQLAGFAEKDVRIRLAKQGQALAEDEGVFGSPWFVVTRADGESISAFGSDRFEHIAAFLHKPYLGTFANGETPKL